MISAKIPMRLVSEANARADRMEVAGRTANHRQAARMMVHGLVPSTWKKGQDRFRVVLVRIGPKLLDREENLGMALKAVKDGVADALGYRDDSDPRLEWFLDQTSTINKKEHGVKIAIFHESELGPSTDFMDSTDPKEGTMTKPKNKDEGKGVKGEAKSAGEARCATCARLVNLAMGGKMAPHCASRTGQMVKADGMCGEWYLPATGKKVESGIVNREEKPEASESSEETANLGPES